MNYQKASALLNV